MKKKWWFLIIPVCLLILIWVCSPVVRLVPEKTRQMAIPSLTPQEKTEIKADTRNLNEEQIFWYGVTKAKDDLKFTRGNDVTNKKANCWGYAAYAKQIIDYGLKVNGYKNKTYHYIGHLEPFGLFDLNKIAFKILPEKDGKFFKDHDFVGIEMDNGREILFSPSLYDVVKFGCRTDSYFSGNKKINIKK